METSLTETKADQNLKIDEETIFNRGRLMNRSSRGSINPSLDPEFKNFKIEFGINKMTSEEVCWVYFQFEYSGKDSFRKPLIVKEYLTLEQVRMTNQEWEEEIKQHHENLRLKFYSTK